MPATAPGTNRMEIAAWIIVAAALLLVFIRHLVPALIAGLLFFMILDRVAVLFARKLSHHQTIRFASITTVVLMTAGAFAGAIALLVTVVRSQMRRIPELMGKMADILESTRLFLLKVGGYQLLPEAVQDAEDLKVFFVGWLKEHRGSLAIAGETFALAFAHILMALLLASMVFLRHIRAADKELGPLGHYLLEKIDRLTTAFWQVVSAQVKISAINTALTAIYILVILPLAGRPLDFSYTIIFVTFVCGLIPVLGNLISNTVIVIVSLGVSFGTAVASLAFLVIIHKLEYLVNSKIVGGKTDSQVWEILLSILLGEALFGVPGVVMGPIVYTFVKKELEAKALV